MRFSSALVVCILLSASTAFGQLNIDGRRNVITTAVPFLTITPDSRSGAMGDAGVALDPDANTIHWNPAKLAYMENPFGMAISYTPWLKNLVPDINLNYLSGYYRIDKLSGFGASLRYFTLGEINFTDINNQDLGTFSPNEFSLDVAYARKLSDNFSVGVALRYIYSNLSGQLPTPGGGETRPGMSFAGDISWYYRKKAIEINGYKADWALGMNISNIGSKISYIKDAEADFIPTNMKFGGYFNFHIDDHNELGLAIDLNKLMIPTLPVITDSIDPSGNFVIAHGRNPDVGVPQGMVQSFYDAPGTIDPNTGEYIITPFREEMREINPSIGLEYWYNRTFAVRAGYFYEHWTKGNRQYMTLGIGIKYNTLGLDFSYLVDTQSRTAGTSPLANTIRFSLVFNFNENAEPLSE